MVRRSEVLVTVALGEQVAATGTRAELGRLIGAVNSASGEERFALLLPALRLMLFLPLAWVAHLLVDGLAGTALAGGLAAVPVAGAGYYAWRATTVTAWWLGHFEDGLARATPGRPVEVWRWSQLESIEYTPAVTGSGPRPGMAVPHRVTVTAHDQRRLTHTGDERGWVTAGTSDWARFGPALVDDFVAPAVARIMGALLVGRATQTGSVRSTPDGGPGCGSRSRAHLDSTAVAVQGLARRARELGGSPAG
jgi:hypothetical protein